MLGACQARRHACLGPNQGAVRWCCMRCKPKRTARGGTSAVLGSAQSSLGDAWPSYPQLPQLPGSSLHKFSRDDIHHVVGSLGRALLCLLGDEQDRIHSPLGVDAAPTHVVLQSQPHTLRCR